MKPAEVVINFGQLTPDLLKTFTRDQLRTIASKFKIPRGRDKRNTIINLLEHARLGVGPIGELTEVKIIIITKGGVS
ncbi:MAG: hypothetical protein ACFFG0_01115 [Candidatus Thorarchaeota archaeon]